MIGVITGIGLSAVVRVYSAVPTSCNVAYRHDTIIKTANDSIVAQVAKTDAQRTTGLSGRACIGADQGMLFEFDNPGLYPFWMKDMKFPIDMVWINANHTVVTVDPAVLPSSYPSNFVSSAPAQYVLELQAGRARTLNITPGTNLQFNP